MEVSNAFGRQLGQQLGLTEAVSKERKLKPLLINLVALATMIAGAIYVATIEDPSEISSGGSRKAKANAAILRIIFETIGQRACVALAVVGSLVLAYNLYKRFTNPASNIVFTRAATGPTQINKPSPFTRKTVESPSKTTKSNLSNRPKSSISNSNNRHLTEDQQRKKAFYQDMKDNRGTQKQFKETDMSQYMPKPKQQNDGV